MAAPQAPYIGKQGKLALDEAVFGERFHGPLVHEAVRAELAARRRGTASTKTRAEVAMTGAKAWRQKGTGRARVGALSSPQRTGGGVAFGPKPRAYTVKVNRKAQRRALRAALALPRRARLDRGRRPERLGRALDQAGRLGAGLARRRGHACWSCSPRARRAARSPSATSPA